MWNDQDRFKGYDKRKDITRVKEVKAQRQVWAMRKKMRDHKFRLIDTLFGQTGDWINIFGSGTTGSKLIGYIYVIKNIVNNRYYVGVTTNIVSRKDQHLFALRKYNHHNSELQKDFIACGEKKFLFGIVEFVYMSSNKLSREYIEEDQINNKLLSKESFWINKFKSQYPNGYNNPSKKSRLEINEFIDIVDEFKNKVVKNV